MITRLILSLKKSSDPRKGNWSLGDSISEDRTARSAISSRHRRQDDILLEIRPYRPRAPVGVDYF